MINLENTEHLIIINILQSKVFYVFEVVLEGNY